MEVISPVFVFDRQLYCFDLSGLIVWQSARYSDAHSSLCASRGGVGGNGVAMVSVCDSHPWENLMAAHRYVSSARPMLGIRRSSICMFKV